MISLLCNNLKTYLWQKKTNYPMNKLATQPLGVTSDSTSGFVPKP